MSHSVSVSVSPPARGVCRSASPRPPRWSTRWSRPETNGDELGFVPLSKTGAKLLFEVFSQRYERGSVLVTTNPPFDEWTEVFGSERLTGALLIASLTASTSLR